MERTFRRYFAVSSEDRRWGFYVTSAGHSIVSAGAAYPVGHHPERYHFEWNRGRVLEEFALLLVANGSGTFERREASRVSVQRGDVLFIPPNLLHRYRPDPKTGWEEYWVTFDGLLARRWHSQDLFAHRIPLVAHSTHLAVVQRFEELINVARKKIYAPQLLAALTQAVLFEALTFRPEGMLRKTEEDRLRQVAEAIREHPDQFDLKSMATVAEMGESTFRRKFFEYFGVSPAHYAQEERINQAKRWLSETPLTVCDIADRLGFSSEFYFMRAFKRGTGCTPSEWRRKQQSKANPM